MRAATPELAAAVLDVFERRGLAQAPRPRAGDVDERMPRHVAFQGDQGLLVGVAVRDQLAVGRDDQRVAVVALSGSDRPSATFLQG